MKSLFIAEKSEQVLQLPIIIIIIIIDSSSNYFPN